MRNPDTCPYCQIELPREYPAQKNRLSRHSHGACAQHLAAIAAWHAAATRHRRRHYGMAKDSPTTNHFALVKLRKDIKLAHRPYAL